MPIAASRSRRRYPGGNESRRQRKRGIVNFEVPAAWIDALWAAADRRGDRLSTLCREALREWAEKRQIDLEPGAR